MSESNVTILKKAAKSVVEANPEFVQHPSATTSDSTPVIIATVLVANNSGGLLEVKVKALKNNGSLIAVWIYAVAFRKNTTLIIKTPVLVMKDDSELTGAVSIVNSGENLAIQVTGTAIDTVVWRTETKTEAVNATNLP